MKCKLLLLNAFGDPVNGAGGFSPEYNNSLIKGKIATTILGARKGVKEDGASPGCAQPYFWCHRWQLT